MSIIILDLDNCISDDGWRIKHIDFEQKDLYMRYHAYHSLSAFDKTGNVDLYLETPHQIVVFTARPGMYTSVTVEWMRRKGVEAQLLFMRSPSQQGVHSIDLKREYLTNLITAHNVDPHTIECAYDDRQDVVDMYREFGISAQVRKIHDQEAWRDDPIVVEPRRVN